MDAFDAQDFARDHSLRLLEEARTIATKPDGKLKPMGSHPSMIQLAARQRPERVCAEVCSKRRS